MHRCLIPDLWLIVDGSTSRYRDPSGRICGSSPQPRPLAWAEESRPLGPAWHQRRRESPTSGTTEARLSLRGPRSDRSRSTASRGAFPADGGAPGAGRRPARHITRSGSSASRSRRGVTIRPAFAVPSHTGPRGRPFPPARGGGGPRRACAAGCPRSCGRHFPHELRRQRQTRSPSTQPTKFQHGVQSHTRAQSAALQAMLRVPSSALSPSGAPAVGWSAGARISVRRVAPEAGAQDTVGGVGAALRTDGARKTAGATRTGA